MILTDIQRHYLQKIQTSIQLGNFACPYPSSLYTILHNGQYEDVHRMMLIDDIIPAYQIYLTKQKIIPLS